VSGDGGDDGACRPRDDLAELCVVIDDQVRVLAGRAESLIVTGGDRRPRGEQRRPALKE
jgi:hypothetical protein